MGVSLRDPGSAAAGMRMDYVQPLSKKTTRSKVAGTPRAQAAMYPAAPFSVEFFIETSYDLPSCSKWTAIGGSGCRERRKQAPKGCKTRNRQRASRPPHFSRAEKFALLSRQVYRSLWSRL